jgi:hypothetical protein
VADDAPCNETSHLDKTQPPPILRLEKNRIMLVAHGRIPAVGRDELPRPVADAVNPAFSGHTVDVDIEDRHEDADPANFLVEKRGAVHGINGNHFSVRRRNHLAGPVGYGPIRIPEKTGNAEGRCQADQRQCGEPQQRQDQGRESRPEHQRIPGRCHRERQAVGSISPNEVFH